jgi:hypothetical protein
LRNLSKCSERGSADLLAGNFSFFASENDLRGYCLPGVHLYKIATLSFEADEFPVEDYCRLRQTASCEASLIKPVKFTPSERLYWDARDGRLIRQEPALAAINDFFPARLRPKCSSALSSLAASCKGAREPARKKLTFSFPRGIREECSSPGWGGP